MITEFISMNGYGLFVWTAYSFCIVACLVFYLKTKKTLKKYEREFSNELKKLSESDRKKVLKDSKVANQILVSQNKVA
tara:strand:+ start:861 stop:1094 length:234 start_codon:yes stop_codon:yes gene_type:complete